MKSKETVRIKKQSVALKDLKTRKNPKGGTAIVGSASIMSPIGRDILTGSHGSATVFGGHGC